MARDWPAERVVRERGTPHAGPPPVPSPRAAGPAPRAPPPPRARTACGIEESRARARRGPARESRQASPGKASERGGAGGGVSEGLERVLSKKKKKKLGHAPRGILGANSLIGGVCCFCRCRRCHLRTAPVCRANAARPAGVVRGHGLTPAGGRTRAHARSGREGSLWARHAASWSPARVSPAGATLGRRWWLGGEAPPSLKTVKGVFTLKIRAVRE